MDVIEGSSLGGFVFSNVGDGYHGNGLVDVFYFFFFILLVNFTYSVRRMLCAHVPLHPPSSSPPPTVRGFGPGCCVTAGLTYVCYPDILPSAGATQRRDWS